MSEARVLPGRHACVVVHGPHPRRASHRPARSLLIGAIVLAASARLQGASSSRSSSRRRSCRRGSRGIGRLLLRLAPTWVALGSLGLLWVGSQLALTAASRSLGAYGVTASRGTTPPRSRAGSSGTGRPLPARARYPARCPGRARLRRRAWPRGRRRVTCSVAVTLSTTFWIPVQVGAFASRYVGQLAERDLIVAAPPLFVCLVVWVARGLPRPQPATSIIAVLWPRRQCCFPIRLLVTPAAFPTLS